MGLGHLKPRTPTTHWSRWSRARLNTSQMQRWNATQGQPPVCLRPTTARMAQPSLQSFELQMHWHRWAKRERRWMKHQGIVHLHRRTSPPHSHTLLLWCWGQRSQAQGSLRGCRWVGKAWATELEVMAAALGKEETQEVPNCIFL